MQIINPYRFEEESATSFDGFGNRSRSFDGVDDYIDANSISSLNNSTSFSLGFWAKKTASNNIISVGSRVGDSTNGFWLSWWSDSVVYATARNAGGISTSYSFSYTSEWVYFSVTFDGTQVEANRLKLYINGSLVATGSGPSSLSSDGANNFLIGLWDSAYSNGKIADVRIYDTDLTATEISDLYNGTNITTNLVGHWLKDADNVLDAAGTNHGTNYGSKYSYDNPSPPVEFGSASRIFNGTSDYVNLGDSDDFSFDNVVDDSPLSFSVWFKSNLSVGNLQTLLAKATNNNSVEYLLTTSSVGGVSLVFHKSGAGYGSYIVGTSSTTYTPNQWTHVVATYDGSLLATGIKIYINGVDDTGTPVSGGAYNGQSNTTADLLIGNRNTSSGQEMSGRMADVRIYNAELTASQVSDLYAGADVQTNLIGHWLTDNDDVEDKAGTNDGTNFGSAYSDDNPPMDLIPFGQKSRLFSSDYINTNTGFQSVFQSSFSISTWVRLDDGIPSNNQMLFGNQSAAPVSRVLIFLDTAGALTFGYFSNGIQARAEIDQNFANGDTGWFHYTAVVEPTGITIYKDGLVQTLDATDDGDMSAVTMGDYGTDIDCYIGARNNDGIPDLNIAGNIADFRIYDSALSASDVTKIYNRTDDKSNIHAWYLTNSDDVLDHAGTNDGTNNGSTYSNDSPS